MGTLRTKLDNVYYVLIFLIIIALLCLEYLGCGLIMLFLFTLGIYNDVYLDYENNLAKLKEEEQNTNNNKPINSLDDNNNTIDIFGTSCALCPYYIKAMELKAKREISLKKKMIATTATQTLNSSQNQNQNQSPENPPQPSK